MYPYSISNNKEVHAILVFGENITLIGNFIKNVLDNSTATPATDDSEAMYVKGTNITIEGNTIIDGGVGDAAIVSKGEYALNYEGMQKNESAFNNVIVGNAILMTKKYYDDNSNRQNFCAIYSHDYSVKISNNQINGYFVSAIKTGVGGSSIDNNFISISNGVSSCEAIVAMAEADTCRGMQINNNTILLPVSISNNFTGLRINTFHQDGSTIRYVKNLHINGNIIQGFLSPIKIQGYKTNAGTITLTDIYIEDNILSNTSTFNSDYGINFTSDNQAGGGPYGTVNATFNGLYIKGNTINNSQNAVSFLGGTNYNNVFIDGNHLNAATTTFNGLSNVTDFTGQSYFDNVSIKYADNTLTGARELIYPTYTKTVTFGNGTTTTFSFAHGLSSIPTYFSFQPTSSVSNFYITADATNVTLNFTTAPPSGSTGFISVTK